MTDNVTPLRPGDGQDDAPAERTDIPPVEVKTNNTGGVMMVVGWSGTRVVVTREQARQIGRAMSLAGGRRDLSPLLAIGLTVTPLAIATHLPHTTLWSIIGGCIAIVSMLTVVTYGRR